MCTLCKESSTCIDNVHKHLTEKHNITKFYSCIKCKKQFLLKHKLRDHIRKTKCDKPRKKRNNTLNTRDIVI